MLRALSGERFDVLQIHVGHRWGKVICRACDASQGIWTTPRDADNHARQLERFAAKHDHEEAQG
ncbi:hypothetical protein ACRAWB_05850 [Leifsonia poae]|uniref:hypothetical protein n=1 Tax=Leifsonia poae TaxID=110933 RepID=UPI003D69DDCE